MCNTNQNSRSVINNRNTIKLSDLTYLTKKELNQYTGWSESKINKLMEGKISYYKDGNILFKRTDIDAYLESLKILGEQEINKLIKR